MRIEETINNAISALHRESMRHDVSTGVQRAIQSLSEAWGRYWYSAERRLTPDVLLGSKLERFTAWYARGWMLMAPDVRKGLPHPRSIAPEFAELVDGALQQYIDSAREVASDATALRDFVEERAGKLRDAIAAPATAILNRVAIVAAVGLVAYVVLSSRK